MLLKIIKKNNNIKLFLYSIQQYINIICFRNNAISEMTQLLVTLRFFATGNFLITAGDFGGVSVAATGQIVKKVSYALASLSDK